jgi:hypothetical protein
VPAFLDEVLRPFYSTGAPTSLDSYAFGQIFWAPAYYPHQQLQLWRPLEVDQKLHTAKNFQITTAPGDAFRRALPYTFPPLKSNEEFLALKAKRRPVVLLQPPDPSLRTVGKSTGDMKIVRHLCVVAPIFSIVDEVGYSKVPEEFRNRVRQLEYLQFTFLPTGGPLSLDSILRLDELQSVAINNLERTDFCLSNEVNAIFRSQVGFFMSGIGGEDFLGYRELLKAD